MWLCDISLVMNENAELKNSQNMEKMQKRQVREKCR